ncbi:tail fiber protein [Kluyvera phage Kvp1]|uniref:Tail fiber protein n=1 Tax=Kluyvera phage Kvp1 TaxID=47049 RepID=B6Z9I0_9CAUD|nr:tail fiber protein [Kluyvera phage Kvp1]ACJ14581.1 tail fiber protein [Kluyvera phage Kvp1]
MALKIRTVMTYPLTGAVDFAITFEYLARKFVTVTLIGKDRKELVLNQDFRFTTKTQITTTRAWTAADGYDSIEIRRYTSATDRLVDFADGSILRAYDLNIAQIQTLHVAEEARDLTADTIGVNNDGHLDARGRRIVNVANPVDDGDAVNLRSLKVWNDSALNSANRAKESAEEAKRQSDWAGRMRNEAEQFKNEANTHRGVAESAKDQAIAARDVANSAKDQASNSRNESLRFAEESNSYMGWSKKWAVNPVDVVIQDGEFSAKHWQHYSKVEADRSKNEADRATNEANKLGSMNALAAAIEKVDGIRVFWKGEQHLDGRLYMTSNGFDCGQYQQFFGGVPGRYSVMEWGDKDGWHLYSERQTEGGTPTLSLRGHMSAGGDIRSAGNQYANNLFQHDREQHWPGRGAFANQYADKAAPFTKTGRFQAPNGYGEYYPILKGTVETQGHGYGTVATFGMLTSGNGRFANGCIHVIGDNGTNGLWQFDPNNGAFHSRGDVKVGDGGIIYQNGDIWGTVWGNRPLTQWLGDQTVNHIAMGGRNDSPVWNAYGIGDGDGKVITGVVNGNADGAIDTIQWRVMQYVRNNGQRFNIY